MLRKGGEPINGLSASLAPPARLELTTLRLGGARSILVSYGGIHTQFMPIYSNQKLTFCQEKQVVFFVISHQNRKGSGAVVPLPDGQLFTS